MPKLIGFIVVISIVLAGIIGLIAAWNTPTMQTARAAAIIAQSQANVEAQQESTAAQRTRDQQAAQTEAAAAPAAVWGRRIAYLGLGSAVAVAALGVAIAIAAGLATRAATIPSIDGQFPLVRVGGFGWSGVVDPNRTTGVSVFRTPTLLDVTVAAVRQLRGQPSALPAMQLEQPLSLSEAGTLALSAQASAVGMVVASSRGGGAEGSAPCVKGPVEALVTRTTSTALALPAVEEEDVSHVERLLALTGAEADD